MGPSIQELYNIVDELNDRFYENDQIEFTPYELQSGGYQNTAILFLGSVIWTSEDYEREYSEEADNYEPLVRFIEKASVSLLNELKKVIKNFDYKSVERDYNYIKSNAPTPQINATYTTRDHDGLYHPFNAVILDLTSGKDEDNIKGMQRAIEKHGDNFVCFNQSQAGKEFWKNSKDVN